MSLTISRCVLIVAVVASPLRADDVPLRFIRSFFTSGGHGLAFDDVNRVLWTFRTNTLRSYDEYGSAMLAFDDLAGEELGEAGLDVADIPFTLGAEYIPPGTVLVTNGKTGTADVHAISPDGILLATLITDFGDGDVVASALAADGGTLFMVQRASPPQVAEVDTITGNTLNTFELEPHFMWSGGIGIEVLPVTNELLISGGFGLARVSPTGEFLGLTTGLQGSLSGLALDHSRNQLFTQTTGGRVNVYAIPEPRFLTWCILALIALARRARVVA
ncbi:MAG: hypothetical protein AAGF97_01545 [Planctomycetota bacterium]